MMDEKLDSPCENNQTTVDRISELPEEIVHRIMHLIGNHPEVVKTSILSKRWLHFLSSFPLLVFDQANFDNKDDFLNFVDKSLCRFSTHNLTIRGFFLTVTDPYLSSFINQWISLLLACNVKFLSLRFDIGTDLYFLPPNIFSSKSITSLSLYSCKIQLSSTCGCNGYGDSVTNFNSLRHLTLYDVQLDDQVINTLLSSSPLLEKLFISCKNLTNLRTLTVYTQYDGIAMKKVDIEALNLESAFFHFSIGFRSCINMSTCQNLKSIGFSEVTIESVWLQETISIFPLLENVDLLMCILEEKINISSRQLRRFTIFLCDGLEVAVIDAPNLLYLHYKGGLEVSLTTTSLSAKWKVDVEATNHVDTLWLHKLREFLPKTSQVKVLDLNLSFRENDQVKMEELQASLFACTNGLEHLKLHNIRSLSANYQSLVDGLFWCCRPQTLSLVFHSGLLKHEDTSNFLKDAYQKLLQQEDAPYGKDILVEIGKESGKTMDAIDLDALLDALPTLRPELVRFRIIKKSGKLEPGNT